jgi:hypothetical protein
MHKRWRPFNFGQMTEENIWGPIDINNWDKTPHLRDRVATEDDVKNGTATFYVQGTDEHKTIDIKLPKLALLTNDTTNEKIKVVVIQAEFADNKQLIGYRFIDGGNGICTLDELTFI